MIKATYKITDYSNIILNMKKKTAHSSLVYNMSLSLS